MGKRHGTWRLIGVAAVLAGFTGCATTTNDEIRAKADMPPPVLEQSGFLYHRSMPGETFASVAKWYSGQESNWREIEKVNPGMNPWRLRKDDIVRVPVAIATLHSDQPAFSTGPRPKPRKPNRGAGMAVPTGSQTSAPAVENAGAEEPAFGPR